VKTILVTGGAGFIGSNFVNFIFRKYSDYKIVVIDALTYAGNLDNILPEVKEAKRFEFRHGNVNNLELLNEVVPDADIIIHFASETHVPRSFDSGREVFMTDVLGTQAIMNAALKRSGKKKRIIFISTSAVYGSALYEPIDEIHPLNPMSPYAAAKTGADRLVYSYCVASKLPCVIARLFNNYGPRQHAEKMIPRFIIQCLLGKPLTIDGDGSASRDWIYVDDSIGALDLIMHAPENRVLGEVFNIGTGKAFTVLEIAKMISAELQLRENFVFKADRAGQVISHVSSTDKSERVLGFISLMTFERGLKDTIRWYKENPSFWEKHVSGQD
jgi:dTDP-glucose 4,6-dehydratase